MVTQYRLRLEAERPEAACAETAYRLYASLLESAPPALASALHEDAVTPVSQYLRTDNGEMLWIVSLFGERAEAALSPALETLAEFQLRGGAGVCRVRGRERNSVRDADELFTRAACRTDERRLRFLTPAAFRSAGRYRNYPSARLLIRSLAQKWNGAFAQECPIEDEDGQGLDALAAGLYCTDYALHSTDYLLKGARIPGFTGELCLQNELSGFHRELADALLFFSQYAGIGIKTALGMGGVAYSAK